MRHWFFLLEMRLGQAFSEAPFLFLTFFFLLGSALKLHFHFLFFCFLLPLFFLKKKRLILGFSLLVLAGFLETHFFYPAFLELDKVKRPVSGLVSQVSLNKTSEEGSALSSLQSTPPVEASASFQIETIAKVTRYNKESYLFRGKLKELKLHLPGQPTYYNLPSSIYYSPKKGQQRPSADYLYALKGKIRQKSGYNYVFKAANWTPLKPNWNFAEKRYRLQRKFEKLLKQKIKHESSFIFLNSQITGFVNSNFWQFIFNKTGLQHVLAISGFQFTALMLFFSFFLKKLPLNKILPWLLLLIINLYNFYIGPSPSVQRAWIGASCAIGAELLGKRSLALNTLGFALFFELVLDPLNLTSLSMQLSFLSVGAILLLFAPLNELLASVLKIRGKRELITLSFFEKIAAHLINYLREVLALSLAVNLALIPLLLFYFHRFPLLGLIYNLFFPFLMCLAFYLLLMALLTVAILPPLSQLCFWLTDYFTAFLLNLLSAYPKVLDFSLRANHFSLSFVVLYLFFFFFFALLLKYRPKNLLPDACQ